MLDISKIERIPFRQDINGLRAVAVLAVDEILKYLDTKKNE